MKKQNTGLVFSSFLATPDLSQTLNSPYLLVSWSEKYLHLAKCVDYFYVEYAEFANR